MNTLQECPHLDSIESILYKKYPYPKSNKMKTLRKK